MLPYMAYMDPMGMAMFNSFLYVYQRVTEPQDHFSNSTWDHRVGLVGRHVASWETRELSLSIIKHLNP